MDTVSSQSITLNAPLVSSFWPLDPSLGTELLPLLCETEGLARLTAFRENRYLTLPNGLYMSLLQRRYDGLILGGILE